MGHQIERFTLALTGDSIVTRRGRIAGDPAAGELAERIQAADAAFTNLEFLPNDFAGYPALESGGSHLAARAGVLDDLRDAGFALFACATNHALDYSIEGLLATIERLDERGIVYAGVGRTLTDARRPAYLDTPAGSVALLSACSTFATGQEAAEPLAGLLGRPGLNPLRFDTVYEVTADHLTTLQTIAEQLGLEQQRLSRIHLGFAFPPDEPEVFPFLDTNFRAATRPAVRQTPKAADLDGISAWVADARNRADLVVVSIHAHEEGASKEDPAPFLQPFAHRMIELGADVVVGHGPHLLRGMEMHQGRPIFYSLGNFVGQNEFVERLPRDSYDRFRTDPALPPSLMFRNRNEDDARGFPSDRRFWETIMPVLRYAEGRLAEIEIVPVTLGLDDGPRRRGRPRLACGEEGAAILDRFAALSRP
ncbi:MAG: CapA family protein, partial [Thermomicrobiales bacterium]